jgi:hypothetical protein
MIQSLPLTYDKKVFPALIRPLCPSRTHGSPLTVFGSGGACVNTGYATGIQAFEAEAIVRFDGYLKSKVSVCHSKIETVTN